MSYRSVNDYATVEGRDLLDLEQQVREMLNDGWQPVGGGFSAVHSERTERGFTESYPLFYQTMVKREEVK